MSHPHWTTAVILLVATVTGIADGLRPNIIILMSDDIGTGDYQRYDPAMVTPNLEKLAARGVVMNQSYTLQACTPTRTALLTGKYPFKIGFHIGKIKGNSLRWVNATHKFLPSTMKELNYSTHALGKWHLGYCHWNLTPTFRGFDTFYGFLRGSQGYFTHKDRRNRSYDFRDNERVAWENAGKYSTELHTTRLQQIIRTEKRPFFVYMAYQNAHDPWEASERYLRMCDHVLDERRRTHCAMVAAMDESIGNITQTLDEEGLTKNTILIYLSDNGAPIMTDTGGYNWPLRGGKASYWEGGTRSHTIFVYPRKMKKHVVGSFWDSMFHVTDFYPTLVRAAGGVAAVQKLQPGLDGFDQFVKITRGFKGIRQKMVYSIDETKNRSAVRIGDFKLITGKPASARRSNSWVAPPDLIAAGNATTKMSGKIPYKKLYNVRRDPSERRNLYGIPKFAEKQQELEDFLAEEEPKLVPFPKVIPSERMGQPEYYSDAVSPGWCCPPL